jgi:hypothetical protein
MTLEWTGVFFETLHTSVVENELIYRFPKQLQHPHNFKHLFQLDIKVDFWNTSTRKIQALSLFLIPPFF